MKLWFRRRDAASVGPSLIPYPEPWTSADVQGLTADTLSRGVLKRAAELAAQSRKFGSWDQVIRASAMGLAGPPAPWAADDTSRAQVALYEVGREVYGSERRARSFYLGGIASYMALTDVIKPFMPRVTERVHSLASMDAPQQVGRYLQKMAQNGFPGPRIETVMRSIFMNGANSINRQGFPQEHFRLGSAAVLGMSYHMLFEERQADTVPDGQLTASEGALPAQLEPPHISPGHQYHSVS